MIIAFFKYMQICIYYSIPRDIWYYNYFVKHNALSVVQANYDQLLHYHARTINMTSNKITTATNNNQAELRTKWESGGVIFVVLCGSLLDCNDFGSVAQRAYEVCFALVGICVFMRLKHEV